LIVVVNSPYENALYLGLSFDNTVLGVVVLVGR